MVPALRRSSSLGNDLNVSALRSRVFSSTKLFILVSAAMMSGLVPTAFLQTTVVAKPPVSPQPTIDAMIEFIAGVMDWLEDRHCAECGQYIGDDRACHSAVCVLRVQ